ncbi:MAG: M28 family peptidase, partial [Lentisphaeria bacterium]|nr:M28 family peptidase [Lentisphaeria bacterium]
MSTPVSQAQWRRYAKKQFDSERVIRDIQTIYEKARWCSTAKFQQLCRALSKQLVSEGFSNVEILQVPGDGKHHYGGWTAPLSWSPKNATLDILADKKERLANYKKIPHQLMMFSGSTPAAGIKADLIIAPEKITRHNVKNKIVLHGRYNDLDYNLALFKAGARGVICDKVVEIKGIKEGKYLDDAIAYHNYSLPCWHIPRKERGIGFVISPRQGRLLRERLSAGEKIRLEAKVDIAIGEETTPLLTCRIPGRCAKDIVLTGHMDEPGASDNASGPAMALEIGRSMLALQKGKEKPVLERGLRFFFGIEVRSMQWLLNEQPKYMARACLGLNLDMLCTNPKKSKAEFIIHPNQASLPDYGLPILLDNLTELTKRPEYKLHFHNLDTNDNAMGEPATGVPTPILLLCPDTTYHTHFDNPSICHAPSIKRLGNCLTTYIGWLANADLQQLTGMAEINFNFAKKELTKNCEEIAQGKVHDPQVFGKHCLKREQGRINGLKKLQSQHNCISLVDGQTKSIPKPGLNLADQVIFSNTLDALCLKLEKFWQGKIKSLKNPKTTDLDISKALQNKARALVPVKTFRGFFSPSGLDEKQKAEIWP